MRRTKLFMAVLGMMAMPSFAVEEGAGGNTAVAPLDSSASTGGAPQGIVGEIVNEFHKLEEKVEHLIHPEAAGEPQSAAGETAAANAAAAPNDTSATTTAAPVELASTPVGGEQGNASAGSGDSKPVGSGAASTITDAAGEDPNAGALPVASQAAGAGVSSVVDASLNAVTLATAASVSLADRIRSSTSKLRAHLWTFERAAVADLHAELDKLESLI